MADIIEKVEIPENIEVKIEEGMITVKGAKGEIVKCFFNPGVTITVEDKNIVFKGKQNKNNKRMIGTFKSHSKNMFKGVTEGHTYKVKICSGHFPMNVSLSKTELNVKNFLGEKIPRIAKIPNNVETKMDGDIITITSTDKESAGQTAASFEQLTRITNRDRRIFQDGLYIIEKDGKEIK